MRAFKLFQWRPRLLYTRHNLGPGFGCAETALTPCLTDAVMKGVKVWGRLLWDGMWVLVQPKSCSCSGISVVQSCRKYRNSLLWPYLYSLINGLTMSYQMGCMSGPVGSYPYRLFNLDLRFWLKMLLRRRLRVEAQIHYPLCFGRIRWWYIFP